jgi:ATPase subunit of ABC transporter with duplicated ATPase domains
MVIGALGAGKSTVMSIISNHDLTSSPFVSSNSVVGCTQQISTYYSDVVKAYLTDTPGLGDKNIPVSQWLNIYNDY